MGLYEYNTALSDLSNRYSMDAATQERGRFLGQQRFARQRADMNQQYARQFPQVTGRLARRFGSKYRSGQIGATVGRSVNDFGQSMGRLDQDQALYDSDQMIQQTQRDAAYQRALLRLREQLDSGRVLADPFAIYSNVWGR